jgi:hypothetical protein
MEIVHGQSLPRFTLIHMWVSGLEYQGDTNSINPPDPFHACNVNPAMVTNAGRSRKPTSSGGWTLLVGGTLVSHFRHMKSAKSYLPTYWTPTINAGGKRERCRREVEQQDVAKLQTILRRANHPNRRTSAHGYNTQNIPIVGSTLIRNSKI